MEEFASEVLASPASVSVHAGASGWLYSGDTRVGNLNFGVYHGGACDAHPSGEGQAHLRDDIAPNIPLYLRQRHHQLRCTGVG